MTTWLDLLDDATPITAIFGRLVPSIDNLELFEMTLSNSGPSVILRSDLSEYPDNPPPKWIKAQANRVQL